MRVKASTLYYNYCGAECAYTTEDSQANTVHIGNVATPLLVKEITLAAYSSGGYATVHHLDGSTELVFNICSAILKPDEGGKRNAIKS